MKDPRAEYRESKGAGRALERKLEAHRRYNREYMRCWRADPAHRERERLARKCGYPGRKERRAVKNYRPYTNLRGEPICGFCRTKCAIAEVVRLLPTRRTRTGFVEIRLPYCGEC